MNLRTGLGTGTLAPPTGKLMEAAKPYDVDIMLRASETFKGGVLCEFDCAVCARTLAIVDTWRKYYRVFDDWTRVCKTKDIDEACKALEEILERRKTCETHIWASHTASSSSH